MPKVFCIFAAQYIYRIKRNLTIMQTQIKQLYIYLALFCTSTICFIACNTPSQQIVLDNTVLNAANQVLYDTVGAKHDTAMLLMKAIGQQQYRLRAVLNTSDTFNVSQDELLGALLGLKKADDAMMRWMRKFKGIELEEAYYLAQTADSIARYLRLEEDKIEAVHRQMLESIRAAKQIQ